MSDKLDGLRKGVEFYRAKYAETRDPSMKLQYKRWLIEAQQDLAWELRRRGETESAPTVASRGAQGRG